MAAAQLARGSPSVASASLPPARRRCSRLAASGERRVLYGRIALGPQPLVLFVSWTRRVKARERGRHRVSHILNAFGEFGAADGASLAEESLGAIESLSELLVWLV